MRDYSYIRDKTCDETKREGRKDEKISVPGGGGPVGHYVRFSSRHAGAGGAENDQEELKSLLGNPDVVILDVRTTPDYNSGSAKIKGAVRVNMTVPIETWIDRYPKEKMYVFYCS